MISNVDDSTMVSLRYSDVQIHKLYIYESCSYTIACNVNMRMGDRAANIMHYDKPPTWIPVFSGIGRLTWLILWYGECSWRWGSGLKPCSWCFYGLSIGILFFNCILQCHCKLTYLEETLSSHFVDYFTRNYISTIRYITKIPMRLRGFV